MRYALAAVSVILLASFESEVDSYKLFGVQNDAGLLATDIDAYRLFDAQDDAETYETEIEKPEQVVFIPERKSPELEALEKKFNDLAEINMKLLKQVEESPSQLETVLNKISELEESNRKKIALLEKKNDKMEKELEKTKNELVVKTTAMKQQKVAPVQLEPYQPKQTSNTFVKTALSFWDWIKVIAGKVLHFFGLKF